LLADCLRSIEGARGQTELEVIVVDSGSSDGSTTLVREEFPWVKLLDCRRNVGFPKGNNLGMMASSGRYVLFLNPDTVVLGEAMQVMVRYLEENPAVGAVGGQLLNADGSVQSSRRRFPTLATALFESTWLQPLAPKNVLDRYTMADRADEVITEVDWLVGACLMVRRQAIEQVGLMDEGYFMYSEELDWCRRLKQAGWRIVYLPASQIIHYLGKSSEQAVTSRHINFQRAKLRYFYKFHGQAAGRLLRLVLILSYLWQMKLEVAKYVLGHKRPLRQQRVRAYWQVLGSGLPPAGR
jgi:GT2 family glycosyltransferase